MGIGQPGARPLDDDHPQAETLGGTPSLREELAPRAECAVEPQHYRTRGIAELGIAEPTAVGQEELTFRPRLFDARDSGRMPQRVVHRLRD